MKENNLNNSNDVKKRINIYVAVILIVVTIIISAGYAKYGQVFKGEANVQIAKMICEMEVIPNEESEPVINPYCTIKVKNYKPHEDITDSEEDIADTDINYKIQVIQKDDLESVEYHWKNSEGTIIAENTELTGSFVNGVKDEAEYKIVFLNSGDKDISKSVEFKLVAVQATK